MALDLSGLERAAARLGRPLRARVVPPSRRAAAWFTVRGGELLVSERVLERLSPRDGEALLLLTLVRRRRMRRAGAAAFAVCCAAGLGAGLGMRFVPSAAALWIGAAALLAAAVSASLLARASLTADDEAADLCEDAETLVRAMNTMNQDQIRIGSLRVSARPDLHARAERIARERNLRGAPRRAPRAEDAAGQCAVQGAEGCADLERAESAPADANADANAERPS